MIRFYRAPWSTNCERVALGLAHKGLEAEAMLIDYSDRSAVELVSGQGLVPVIDDHGTVVHDSINILRYLDLTRSSNKALFPNDAMERAAVEIFIEWFDAVWKQAPNRIEEEMESGEPDETLVAELSETMDRHLDRFEALLSDHEYVNGGAIGAADFVAFPFLRYAAGRPEGDDELFHRILDEHQDLEGRSRLSDWIAQIDDLPRTYG